MNSTIKQIESYINLLKSKFDYEVTLHNCHDSRMAGIISLLAPYNIHSCEYCLCMKTNREIWDKCIKNQTKVINKLKDGEFFGMCYLGVCEFVFPIEYDGVNVGFICVSGYKNDDVKAKSKLKYACESFNMDYNEMVDLYNSSLKSDIPSQSEVETAIFPLICMIKQLLTESAVSDDITIYDTTNSYINGHILAFLNLHYSEKITIQDICNLCHCSPSHASHVFSKLNGCSIMEYIANLRMREAKALLRKTTMRIHEVAFTVGYTDSNYFSNVFKAHVGLSPKMYRAKNTRKTND